MIVDQEKRLQVSEIIRGLCVVSLNFKLQDFVITKKKNGHISTDDCCGFRA